MSDTAAIEAVAKQIKSATDYLAIFGTLSGDVSAQKSALRKQFAYLAKVVHPDHAPRGSESLARDTFEHLNKVRQGAERAIEVGSYDQPFKDQPPSADDLDESFTIQSPAGTYHLLTQPFRSGDFSILYRGWAINGARTAVVAKIASIPMHNGWLEAEASILARFRDAPASDTLSGIRRFVPHLADAFVMAGEDGTHYRVSIVHDTPDFVSITDVIEAYSYGLAPQEAAWIFRRVIAQTLAASMAGVVHCAIVPDHVLVDPFKHEPLHIGWVHAILDPARSGQRITQIIERWRDWYPPEVFDRKPPDHRTDLYMAGKTMIQLLGGDVKRDTLPRTVPDSVARIILPAVEKSPSKRPQDGLAFLDAFTNAIRKEWGSVYRPLMMPVR